MTRSPDFDELVGQDMARDERDRLRRTHDLLVEAGPPPELSPELEQVPWPDDALAPVFGRRKQRGRRPILLAAAIVTAVVVGFVLGQATKSSTSSTSTSIDARATVQLHGTVLARGALASLELGKPDSAGNWPMVLHVNGLPKLGNGGYYDLYLTKSGMPLVSCGTINARGDTVVRMSAAYNLENFDPNGWVIVRKTPSNNFDASQIVLKAA